MLPLLERLVRGEVGQDLAEYGIALAVVAAAVALAALAIAVDVTAMWTNASNVIHSAV